jgi:hypothetical protein
MGRLSGCVSVCCCLQGIPALRGDRRHVDAARRHLPGTNSQAHTLPTSLLLPAQRSTSPTLCVSLRLSCSRARSALALTCVRACVRFAARCAVAFASQAQAVFAQQATIPASRCEARFRNLPDPANPGQTIQEFTFNKGL